MKKIISWIVHVRTECSSCSTFVQVKVIVGRVIGVSGIMHGNVSRGMVLVGTESLLPLQRLEGGEHGWAPVNLENNLHFIIVRIEILPLLRHHYDDIFSTPPETPPSSLPGSGYRCRRRS